MKYISYINWAIIAFYIILAIYQLATLSSANTDAAGKGMIGGFAIVIFIVGLLLAGLNLITVKWVKAIVFLLCTTSLYYIYNNLL